MSATEHPSPKQDGMTQCIAAKAVIIDGNKALVLQQSSDANVSNANRFHPPGGIVEPGESLQATLLREIDEETGLRAKIIRLLSIEEWRANIRGTECQFFGAFYLCELDSEANVRLDHESSSYRWINLDELGEVDIVEPSLSVLRRALADITNPAA